MESILNEDLSDDDCNSPPDDKTSVESNGKDKKVEKNYKDDSLINDILNQVVSTYYIINIHIYIL